MLTYLCMSSHYILLVPKTRFCNIKETYNIKVTAAVSAQSVERLTAEREVAGSIPRAEPILRVLKWLRNEGTPFALQQARPSRGSDDHVKCRSRLQVET